MEVLLASFLMCQDPSAAFKKIQEAVESAASVHVSFSGEATTRKGGRTQAYAGILLLKEGNKVHLSVKSPDGTKETAVFSDGTRMRMRSSAGLSPERPAESGLAARHRAGLAYVGVFAANPLLLLAQGAGGKPFEAMDFQGGKDGDGDFIAYKFKVAGRDEVGTAKTWYDAKSFRLLKRTGTISIDDAGIAITFSETYRDFSLAEIPDDKFALPRD